MAGDREAIERGEFIARELNREHAREQYHVNLEVELMAESPRAAAAAAVALVREGSDAVACVVTPTAGGPMERVWRP